MRRAARAASGRTLTFNGPVIVGAQGVLTLGGATVNGTGGYTVEGTLNLTNQSLPNLLNLSGTLVGRFVDSDFSSLEPAILQNSGRTVWNAQFSYRATAAMTGILSINNVTGRDYQEPLGYLALQRAVRAGVRVRF